MLIKIILLVAAIVCIGLFLYLMFLFQRSENAAYQAVTELELKISQREKSIAELQREKKELLRRCAERDRELKTLSDAIRLNAEREAWCDQRLVEMPPGTPKTFHETTLKYASFLLNRKGTFFDLCSERNFRKPSGWQLYWSLANASASALQHVGPKIEDGITGEFVRGLEKQNRALRSMCIDLQPSLQMAYCKIYEQAAPALKESHVGADLLLIVAGNQLVPGGGARIFWLQAKRQLGNSFVLDCSQSNSIGQLQVDALKKVDAPKKGSFSMYMQYSNDLPFIPALALCHHMPAGDYQHVDLSLYGVRLAEIITTFSAAENDFGTFSDASEVIKFLDFVGANRPVYVVAACDTADRTWNRLDLISKIERHYQREMGIDSEIGNEKEHGPEFDY